MKSGFQTGNGLAQSNSPPSVTGGRRHQGKFQHPVKGSTVEKVFKLIQIIFSFVAFFNNYSMLAKA
jgi:hypothetical protein